jgi:hypothetical protein
MSVSVTVAGVSYTIPQTGEVGWGDQVTAWIQKVSNSTLQTSGGSFSLTADVDFGNTYGLKAAYFTSKTANSAASGVLRLANADSIAIRNAGNTADLLFKASATGDGFLAYNGVDLVGLSLTQTLTNKTISGASNTLSNIGYSALLLTGSIVNADVSNTAAIAYSKLNLTGNIVNADIGAAAAIAYSKLSLTGTIVNADISATAAIARSKLASGTASHVLINDGTGVVSSEAQLAISRGGTGQATKTAGFDALSPNTTRGDLTVHNGTNNVRLAVGTSGKFIRSDGTDPSWQTLTSADIPNALPVSKTTVATQAISALDIDWSTGSLFTKTLAANSTFTFSNKTSGQTIVVRLTNTASNYTVTWPTVKWTAGAAPTMTTGAKSDVYTFVYDGTDVYGSVVQNFS